MKMLFLLLAGSFALSSVTLAEDASRPVVKMLWVATNRMATTNVLKSEFAIDPFGNQAFPVNPRLQITLAPIDADKKPNPFFITDKDFVTGYFLPNLGGQVGPVPVIDPSDAIWFDDLIANGNAPDVFQIGGHHVISEGWHSDNEHQFMFHPTFLETLKTYPAARETFDHVKLAILGGCNTMTDLEPHGPNGEFLSTEAIRSDYFQEDGRTINPRGRAMMIGLNPDDFKAAPLNNSVEFYKQRLASEYGKNSKKYEYTRSAAEEAQYCTGPYYINCKVTNLERIMPESFLLDGTHRFNEPWRMKRIFRNAYLVLGFSSASPDEETRARILQKTLDGSRKILNAGKTASDVSYVHNPLFTIVDPNTKTELRMKVIEEVRKQWTLATYSMNRQRPSGSITPAFPQLDKNGVFNINPITKGKPKKSAYEARNFDASEIQENSSSIQLH